ncbi:MAG TPA: choice-of-anchor X domain-containing protein [Bryobacteraceae bacterium]|nr:choice-of-anchor X domain-containing protein [Bryobacteraceae bacterium]
MNLIRVDALGRATIVGTMHDDGLNGDATAADNTYSLVLSVFEQTSGTVNYRVSAAFLGSLVRVQSGLIPLTISGVSTGITITAPTDPAYLSISPTTVTGTVGDPAAAVQVNGIAAQVTGTTFSASVPLQEGTNTVTAVATNSNTSVSTASRTVTLDTTPPHITIDTPLNNAVTTAATISVNGIVNDIVVGTVNDQQATVTVNSVPAQVANRTYNAVNVPLTLGSNTITATGRDRAGNFATASVTVVRQPPTQPGLTIVSGNNLIGSTGTLLSAPLVVKLLNGSGQPIANTPVVFSVTSGDGAVSPTASAGLSSVAVNTDVQGQAQVFYTLGSRAGAGNNVVTASSSGIATTGVFTESATATAAAAIVIDSGNSQSGVVGQALPLPFIAIVTDARHNRLGGVTVTFSVSQGGGTLGGLDSITATSDSDGRVQAILTLGAAAGPNAVEATFAGNTALPATFTATALVPGPLASTLISGVVLDNSNIPIPGVTMRLYQTNSGANNNVPQQIGTPVQTNAQGFFQISPAPVGVFKLMADGTTATRPGAFPTLEYDLVTVSGQNNTVGSPIYLPQINSAAQVCVTASTGGTLTVPQAPGFSLTIAPGSATFPGGARSGCVSVTPVNPDKIPMVPGFGQQPRFIVTIQPVGTTFNPPAAITIPNVDGLSPRAVTEMYSYDHDLATFTAIGTGTVSADGSVIASDPGVGVLKAGWHCGGDPNTAGSAGSLGLTASPSPLQGKINDNFQVTANGTPPLDGSYSWELVATQPDDDVTIVNLTSAPTCANQPACVAQLTAVKAGAATLRVHFRCNTTGLEATPVDIRITILKVTLTITGVPDANKVSVGGIVVRNFDMNNAPRQQIVVGQAQPASFTGNLILTRNSAKVKVFDAATAGSEITFNGTDNKFANAGIAAAGKNLWVEGATQSDAMRDITLTLAVESRPDVKDTVTFTVLWVDTPVVRTSGAVSMNNSASGSYTGCFGAGVAASLGGPFILPNCGTRMGWGTEAGATVHPSGFNYPGNDLKLERDNAFHDFVGNGTSTIDQRAYNATIPPGNDTSPATFRDDNPSPDDKIYDLDAPGLDTSVVSPQNEIRRTRNNFKSFASITVGGSSVRASQPQEYLVRFTMKQTAAPTGSTWVLLAPPDVASDNQAGNGSTNLTWDLQ